MTMKVLLKLGENGEPIVKKSMSDARGIIMLPPINENFASDKNLTFEYDLVLFIQAGSKLTNNGKLYLNTSLKPNFQELDISNKSSDHKDKHIHLNLTIPGPYFYYIEYDSLDAIKEDTQTNNKRKLKTENFYFIVPPKLPYDVKLDSISLQSLVSKWVPTSLHDSDENKKTKYVIENDWDPILEKISSKGYNMIHFTPLQKRGSSNSPYSIEDQLEFDPNHFPNGKPDVELLMDHLHNKYKIMSLTDIVLNHTANNSSWLKKHPESGYNQYTAPHLQPAIDLELEILKFNENLVNDKLEPSVPKNIENQEDLTKIMNSLNKQVFENSLKLWEYYIVDSEKLLDKLSCFNERGNCERKKIKVPNDLNSLVEKCLKYCFENGKIDDISNERFGHKLNENNFKEFVEKLFAKFEIEDQLDNDYDDLNTCGIDIKELGKNIIDLINLKQYKHYDVDVAIIKDQISSRLRYLRLDDNGPKLGPITLEKPIIEKYFTPVEHEDKSKGVFYLANNGWIWNANPMLDFASKDSKAYLRREVIIWEDCVKLRYGSSPKDSQYLWDRMTQYVKYSASLFDGFRIDNCHSTPLLIGEYFMNIARSVNPNLYILAELFSGSESLDCIFVERLGINSLLRESMQAQSVKELSTLIHRYAGNPIGTFRNVNYDDFALEYYDYQMLSSNQPPVLIMDCTHDNQTSYQKRTVEDTISSAALVALSCSAIGSVYGFDEIYPYLLDVVNEKRYYSVVPDDGISKIKTILYGIRKQISRDINDYEMFIHQEKDYITFHKVNIRTGEGWYLISRTKFYESKSDTETFIDFNLASTFSCDMHTAYSLLQKGDPINDDKIIKGIPTQLSEINNAEFNISISKTSECKISIQQKKFPQGSIAIFKTKQEPAGHFLTQSLVEECLEATNNLTLSSLNAVLYRCGPEEVDFTNGTQGLYDIPHYGQLKYGGLQGWVSVLRNITFNNEVDHPYCDNLRNGTWALDHLSSRFVHYVEVFPELKYLQVWFDEVLAKIKLLPAGLRPAYFAVIISLVYKTCVKKAISLLSLERYSVTHFQVQLALVSVQVCGLMKNASLVPDKSVSAMAAGLPHFSYGFMRCWGRDIFISLRGLLLTTNRYDDAKSHILSFAKTLKHGLIPNLLDSGNNPRYNSRDSVWFFVQAIKDYVEIVPNGDDILKEKVTRRFPLDDTYVPVDDVKAFSYETSIEDILYEIFQRHASGISFREANAGPNLDRVMKPEGFNIDIHVDWNTGFIHGGSQFNCGTWMDKMGESEKAKSVGVPGTPRDGAAVEIIGLLKSGLSFLIDLHSKKLFKYTKVTREDKTSISFEEWNELIQTHFERCFYVPLDPKNDSEYEVESDIVNRRGIYKDLFKSGKPYEDYQLRPNIMIAMTVAPELFTLEHALNCIDKVDLILKGPLGMRTLDPSDYNYRPYYVNSEDSEDFATSKGRNYHQGPEWVWCFGYFLRAYYHFKNVNIFSGNNFQLQIEVLNKLQPHRNWITNSEWAGLTELTNKDGAICDDSSPTQAWSAGCLLDVLYDISH